METPPEIQFQGMQGDAADLGKEIWAKATEKAKRKLANIQARHFVGGNR